MIKSYVCVILVIISLCHFKDKLLVRLGKVKMLIFKVHLCTKFVRCKFNLHH